MLHAAGEAVFLGAADALVNIGKNMHLTLSMCGTEQTVLS